MLRVKAARPVSQNLLAAGADPDSEDPDRETPLLLALENMHFDTAAVLVSGVNGKGGADLDKWDLFGRSPVYMAADVSTLPMKGNGAVAVLPSADKLTALDVGRMLLEKGANPNIQLKRRPPYRDVPQDRGGDGMLAQGATPLLRAARGGDDKFVALLLEYHALVDLPSKEGITPLMAAAGVDYGSRVTRGRNRTDEGVLATMALLVKAGADVNARSLLDRNAGFGRAGEVAEPALVEVAVVVRALALVEAAVRALALVEAAVAEPELAALLLLLPPAAVSAQVRALVSASRTASAAAVRCRARKPFRTRPLCTAPPNTVSISSSNSSLPMAPISPPKTPTAARRSTSPAVPAAFAAARMRSRKPSHCWNR